MTTNIEKSYHNAILAFYPDAINLRQPTIRGTQQNVIFADTASGTRVFKFSNAETVYKNRYISQLFLKHSIPVPDVTARKYNGLYFEDYPQLAGHTLYEHIGKGMEPAKVQQIYREILNYFAKMDSIPPNALYNFSNKDIHIISRNHIAGVNNKTLAQICMVAVYLLNIGNKSDKGIYHSDITAKNVIVSPDGHLIGFLDLDTIGVGDKNYAFGAMAIKYQQLGLDITELFDYYERISGKKLNRRRILAMAHINNFGKKILWMHQQHKK